MSNHHIVMRNIALLLSFLSALLTQQLTLASIDGAESIHEREVVHVVLPPVPVTSSGTSAPDAAGTEPGREVDPRIRKVIAQHPIVPHR